MHECISRVLNENYEDYRLVSKVIWRLYNDIHSRENSSARARHCKMLKII